MMLKNTFTVSGIPAVLWGAPSDKVFIHVHGKLSRKEHAEPFAAIAGEKGWQTLSFDLPEHGERSGQSDRCDVWTGVRDLDIIADHAFGNWRHVALFACSLGAYFSLNAYPSRKLEKCLFQSPIVDMKWLVEHMMLWAGVTPEMLKAKKRIETPLDTLSWDYYKYILEHTEYEWPFPTGILYAGKDGLQPEASVRAFAARHGAALTVAPESLHPFMAEGDRAIVEAWLRKEI